MRFNTSNSGKFLEFERLFSKHGYTLEMTAIDLPEIDASPLEVIAHKACQLPENTLVEDTSLNVEGAVVGIHVRWLLDHLSDHVGKKAEWVVLLAYRLKNQVLIFRGQQEGRIVFPRGRDGFGFDPVFQPEGSSDTLAESKPDSFNARAKAVEALLQNKVWKTHPLILHWEGLWQSDF